MNSGLLCCYFCGKSHASVQRLYRHMKSHLREETVICPGCKKTFDIIDIKQHRAICQKLRDKFCCQFCGVTRLSTFELNYHIQSVHTKDIIKVQCYFCGKEFNRRNNLFNHYPVHTREKLLKCQHCKLQFQTNRSRQLHMSIKHSKTQEGIFYRNQHKKSCYFCGKMCPSTSLLHAHLQCHTRGSRRKI